MSEIKPYALYIPTHLHELMLLQYEKAQGDGHYLKDIPMNRLSLDMYMLLYRFVVNKERIRIRREIIDEKTATKPDIEWLEDDLSDLVWQSGYNTANA